jgi:hypothetical protein
MSAPVSRFHDCRVRSNSARAGAIDWRHAILVRAENRHERDVGEAPALQADGDAESSGCATRWETGHLANHAHPIQDIGESGLQYGEDIYILGDPQACGGVGDRSRADRSECNVL